MKRDIALFLLILIIFVFRLQRAQPNVVPDQKLKIYGQISQEPYVSGETQVFKIGQIRVYTNLYPEFHYGDWLVVKGVVREGKGGFYFARPEIELGQASPRGFSQIKQRLTSVYRQTLPEPAASLVLGVTLGSKSGLPEDFLEALRNTGTIHVVVASGMNVTLVAGFLTSLSVYFLKRRLALVVALAGVWAYVFLIGIEPPIVRAALMASLVFLAQASGKVASSWRVLILTAGVLLVANPVWVTDSGFLLSFGATAGLIAFSGPIGKAILRFPALLREGFSTSLAAQLGVFPILLFYFGQFAPLSPLVNALTIWTIAPLTILAGVGGIISFIFEPLGKLIILLAYPISAYFVAVVEFFNRLLS